VAASSSSPPNPPQRSAMAAAQPRRRFPVSDADSKCFLLPFPPRLPQTLNPLAHILSLCVQSRASPPRCGTISSTRRTTATSASSRVRTPSS
jgi:hypothetical protein